jgi:hypothetical protein
MQAMPRLTVMIIRHAEKPEEVWPGPGLTAEGQTDHKSLVVRGWQRAGSWATLFGSELGGTDYPKPDVIYAAQPDPYDGPLMEKGKPSHRPYETIRPLADRLALKPVIRWAKGEEAALASEVATLMRNVLVCWEHKLIFSNLIPALLSGQSVAGLPGNWPGERYDVVLRFDREGDQWSIRQLFPRLLSGDTDMPFPGANHAR